MLIDAYNVILQLPVHVLVVSTMSLDLVDAARVWMARFSHRKFQQLLLRC